jgi:hypothetical protein
MFPGTDRGHADLRREGQWPAAVGAATNTRPTVGPWAGGRATLPTAHRKRFVRKRRAVRRRATELSRRLGMLLAAVFADQAARSGGRPDALAAGWVTLPAALRLAALHRASSGLSSSGLYMVRADRAAQQRTAASLLRSRQRRGKDPTALSGGPPAGFTPPSGPGVPAYVQAGNQTDVSIQDNYRDRFQTTTTDGVSGTWSLGSAYTSDGTLTVTATTGTYSNVEITTGPAEPYSPEGEPNPPADTQTYQVVGWSATVVITTQPGTGGGTIKGSTTGSSSTLDPSITGDTPDPPGTTTIEGTWNNTEGVFTTTYTDSNGNTVSITYFSGAQTALVTVTDQFGNATQELYILGPGPSPGQSPGTDPGSDPGNSPPGSGTGPDPQSKNGDDDQDPKEPDDEEPEPEDPDLAPTETGTPDPEGDGSDERPGMDILQLIHMGGGGTTSSDTGTDTGWSDTGDAGESIDLAAFLRGLVGAGAAGTSSPGDGTSWGDSSSDESAPGFDPHRVRAGRITVSADDEGWGDLNNPHARNEEP